MQDDRLEQAIGLVQSGKKENARELLELILKEDRSNISAWHWYTETWSNTKDKIRVWEACLRFNPDNKQVQDALRDLQPSRKTTETITPINEAKKLDTRSSKIVVWGSLIVIIAAAVLGVLL